MRAMPSDRFAQPLIILWSKRPLPEAGPPLVEPGQAAVGGRHSEPGPGPDLLPVGGVKSLRLLLDQRGVEADLLHNRALALDALLGQIIAQGQLPLHRAQHSIQLQFLLSSVGFSTKSLQV